MRRFPQSGAERSLWERRDEAVQTGPDPLRGALQEQQRLIRELQDAAERREADCARLALRCEQLMAQLKRQ